MLSEEYIHAPLQNPKGQFRLLTVLRGAEEDPVRCRLTIHPLPTEEHSERYEAVSWTWGESTNRTALRIVREENNDAMDSFLSVRPNLPQALKRLRYTGDDRVLWIDAVCIRQEDKKEKDLQVQLMFNIYSHATNVCIWLGEHENDSEAAFKFITNKVCNLGAWEAITENENTRDEWKALAALMDRPWFSRRWVVQEIALAKNATVHCGPHQIDWADFEEAVSLFDRDAEHLSGWYKSSKAFGYNDNFFGDVGQMGATRLVKTKSHLTRMDDAGNIIEYRLTLGDLVSNLSSFRAQEPHDLIYAILALANDTRLRITMSSDELDEKSDSSGSTSEDASSANPAPSDFSNDAPMSGQSTQATSVEGSDSSSPNTGNDTLTKLNTKETRLVALVSSRFRQSVLPENRRLFEVNYKQDFFQICRQFLNFTIPKATYPNLDILCRPWASATERELPSWIPSLEGAAFVRRRNQHTPGGYQVRRRNADPLVGQYTHGTPFYNACDSRRAESGEWRISEQDEAWSSLKKDQWPAVEDFKRLPRSQMDPRMYVTGFIFDEIGKIEEASQDGHIPADWLVLGGWSNWENQDSRAPDVLWRTLVADRGPNGQNTKEYYKRAFEFGVHNSVEGLQTTQLKRWGHPILLEFLNRMEAVVWKRRLFKSERDKALGLAPKGASKGDCICIVKGISVPVVLRSMYDKKRKTMYYEFIGECYLHAMMSGRAVKIQADTLTKMSNAERDSVDNPWRWQEFELR